MLEKKAFKLPPLISKFIHEKNSGVQRCTKALLVNITPMKNLWIIFADWRVVQ